VRDLLSDTNYDKGTLLTLNAWDVRVLVDQ
jgi:hypothetical protein